MTTFDDKVCVITGGARGIGFGLTGKALELGMNVVISDIDEEALASAAAKLKANGIAPSRFITVQTDVAQFSDLERLLARTLGSFGKANYLFNNAGVQGRHVNLLDSSVADWEWVIDVNLRGVLHGIKAFVPQMLAQGDECRVINTSSIMVSHKI